MNLKFNWKEKQSYFYLMLLCLPFIDLITALQTRFVDFSITLGIVVKGFILLVIVYYLFFKCKTKYKKISCLYVTLYLLYGLIYLVTKIDGNTFNGLFSECINLFKYGFYPIVVVGLLNMCFEKILDKKTVSRCFIFSFSVYAFFILVPYLTGTGFKSYGLLDISNGTTGWFYAANEIGSIMILLFTFVFGLLEEGKYKLFVIIACVGEYVAFMIGTKVASLGMLIVCALMFLYYLLYKGKDKTKKILLVFLVLAVGLVSFQVGPTSSNVDDSYERYELHKDDLDDIKISTKSQVLRFAISLLSGREVFAIRVSRVYADASVTDKLFGIGFNYRPVLETKHAARLIEMDSLDVLFRFGIIGNILLWAPALVLLFKIASKLITKKLKPNIEFFRYFLIWAMVVSIAMIAGHVLGAPAVSFYLAIITWFMYESLIEKREEV